PRWPRHRRAAAPPTGTVATPPPRGSRSCLPLRRVAPAAQGEQGFLVELFGPVHPRMDPTHPHARAGPPLAWGDLMEGVIAEETVIARADAGHERMERDLVRFAFGQLVDEAAQVRALRVSQ